LSKVTFDAPNRLIIVNEGITELDVKKDLYSEAKRQWKNDPELTKFRFPFRVIGGDPIGGGLFAGSFFFLQNQSGYDWRIRPQEADHELLVIGNLYPEDATLPMFVPTLGNYTVTLKLERSSLTQLADPIIDSEERKAIASDIWSHTVGARVDEATQLLKKIETGRWQIANNQLILYDTDGVTVLRKFDLLDKKGVPTEKDVYERVPV